MKRGIIRDNRGFLIVTSYVILLLIVGFIVALSIRIGTGSHLSVNYQRSQKAFYLAQAGIERAIVELKNGFAQYFYGPFGAWSQSSFNWFDNVKAGLGAYKFPLQGNLETGSYTVDLIDVERLTDEIGRVVVLESVGNCDGVERRIIAKVKYGMEPSRVFDYAYFINNFGWFWGSTITANGDIRSNGNFSLKYSPKVNGDVYAAINDELGSTGEIDGANIYDSLSTYYATAPISARPGNPSYPSEDVNGNGILDPGEDVNGNGVLDTYQYNNGYQGSSQYYQYQQPITMPYLGDLAFYRTVANLKGGRILQKGKEIVSGVYNGDLILIGTDSDPIEINGPVVVTGDVLIKGKVKGQGVIYAGRNIHILGNIEYIDPPQWPKPDSDPELTDANNITKDFLGLAAKGNIILGDYTESAWDYVKYFISPSFTQPYEVDVSDGVNGYISYYSNGEPYFDGNYTAYDGGRKQDGTNRRYYESSFPNTTFAPLADSYYKITRIDAFMYTNHAFAGRVGSLTINGGIVARDEAIIYSGSITMNYDIRMRDPNFRNRFYLPQDLAEPKIISWEER